MKVAFIAAEVDPFAKTGGLADVVAALPRALAAKGIEVRIYIPKYEWIEKTKVRPVKGVEIIFIRNEKYFGRSGIYGSPKGDYKDNLERFKFLCTESLNRMLRDQYIPDIIHCHDWHTAILPVVLNDDPRFEVIQKKAKTLLTIHNLAFQGLFERPYSDLEFKQSKWQKLFEFYGKLSFMRAGILSADRVNTVSPGYAHEITTKKDGCGLEKELRKKRVCGILNGLDTKLWNPAADKSLPVRYDAAGVDAKARSKEVLQKLLGLEVDPDRPLYAMVSRLSEQKGLDPMMEAFDGMMKKGIQLALLGTGDRKYEIFFKNMQKKYKGAFGAVLSFHGAKAPLFYAGSDFFLMPSRFEPCGLGQLIAMRYGSVPVGRKTGGLGDTIIDFKNRSGNGILFGSYSARALLTAVGRANDLYHSAQFRAIQKRGMKSDFSWDRSAAQYLKLYKKMVVNRRS